MAIGSGSEAAQSELQDKYHKVRLWISRTPVPILEPQLELLFPFVQQMTLLEAHALVLKVLKQVMEEKLDAHNVQLSQVSIKQFNPHDFMISELMKCSHHYQVTKAGGFEILDETRLSGLIGEM